MRRYTMGDVIDARYPEASIAGPGASDAMKVANSATDIARDGFLAYDGNFFVEERRLLKRRVWISGILVTSGNDDRGRLLDVDKAREDFEECVLSLLAVRL